MSIDHEDRRWRCAMSCYWVIREGKVRGQGRYLTVPIASVIWAERGTWTRRMAEDEGRVVLGTMRVGPCRLVRVTRKPKADRSTSDYRDGRREGRWAALDDAERFCRAVAEECGHHNIDGHHVATVCADRIAALKDGAK